MALWLYDFFYNYNGDQEGVNCNKPLQIYYNPLYPEFFPVFDLDKYMLEYTTLRKGDCHFSWGFEIQSFCAYFCDVLKYYKDDFIALNVKVSDLGYHITHKGAVKLRASGCKLVPPTISICLHAGWSKVNVKSCYLQYKVAGDQFCGRTVCGLNPMTSDFSVSWLFWNNIWNEFTIGNVYMTGFSPRRHLFLHWISFE